MLYLKKAWSLLRAVSSFVRWGDVPLVEHDRRQKICLGCNRLDVTETGVFCLECRCPHWPLSDLRTKWRMRDLRCPLDKWQPSARLLSVDRREDMARNLHASRADQL